MKKDVIIFDKDGTLIDFDSFWVTVTEYAIYDIKESFGAHNIPNNKFYDAIGVVNGSAGTDSILCIGSFYDMGIAFNNVFKEYGYNIPQKRMVDIVTDAYEKNMTKANVKGTCDKLRELLDNLKKKGKRLIVATADNRKITDFCLEKLGIYDYFERIYTSDGEFLPKPSSECIEEYCKETGTVKDKIVMIGDTMNDVYFAKNAGIDVIILKSAGNDFEKLQKNSDMMIDSIVELKNIIE